MAKEPALLLTVFAGGLIALQAPINSGLGKSIGTFQAAFLSFLLGTIVLAAIAALSGGFGSLAGVREVAPVFLLGGVLGAIYVTTVLVTVRSLGAGGVTAATITGQLAMSVALDQFGLLGVDRDPLTLDRVVGLAFLALGTFLVVRD